MGNENVENKKAPRKIFKEFLQLRRPLPCLLENTQETVKV